MAVPGMPRAMMSIRFSRVGYSPLSVSRNLNRAEVKSRGRGTV